MPCPARRRDTSDISRNVLIVGTHLVFKSKKVIDGVERWTLESSCVCMF